MHQDVVQMVEATERLCCGRFEKHRKLIVDQAAHHMERVHEHIVEAVYRVAGAVHRRKTDLEVHYRGAHRAAAQREAEQEDRVNNRAAEEAVAHSLGGVEDGLTAVDSAAVVLRHNIPQIRLLCHSAADSAPPACRSAYRRSACRRPRISP